MEKIFIDKGWQCPKCGKIFSPSALECRYCNSSINTASTITTVSITHTSNTENNQRTKQSLIEAVDLGLSVKWATCNVGATKPEEYGNYYAWGETEPKATYNWDTYKYGSYDGLTKYCTDSNYSKEGCVDNKRMLDPEDDAARVNWSDKWRIPTGEEWVELRDSCVWTWTTRNGVNGYEVKSKINGNIIFLPAAGYHYYDDFEEAGTYGRYWSSSLYTCYPYYALDAYFNSSNVGRYCSFRYCGRSVRPVLPNN